MKQIFIFLCILLSVSSVSAQNIADSITYQKKTGGYKFYQYDMKLNVRQLTHAVSSEQEAYSMMKKVRVFNTVSNLTGIAGLVLLLVPLYQVTQDQEVGYGYPLLGASLILTYRFAKRGTHHRMMQAADMFNSSLEEDYPEAPVNLVFGPIQNGIGLRVVF